jgi:hypothetical protein
LRIIEQSPRAASRGWLGHPDCGSLVWGTTSPESSDGPQPVSTTRLDAQTERLKAIIFAPKNNPLKDLFYVFSHVMLPCREKIHIGTLKFLDGLSINSLHNRATQQS